MRFPTPRWFGLAVVSTVVLLAGSTASAQAVTSSRITGAVYDATEQPLPGAAVVATHLPSGTEYGTSTRADGSFTLPNVRVGGPYRVRASFIGYRAFVEEGFQLTLGDALDLDIVLEDETAALGDVVVEAGGLFDPNRSGVDTNISSEQILSTPSIGRDVADFVRLTPQAYVGNDDDDGPSISIAGQNNRYNAIYIDGAVNNDVFGLSAQGTNGGQTGSTPISIDAIEQFQVALSPFDVTQSGFTGGAINAVTRSGTNEFEGSLYGLFRNEGFVGDTPALSGAADPVSEFSANRYGFRLGGPILRNKLFFFVNGEILRQETPLTAQAYTGTSAGQLDVVRQTLVDELGYDPGAFGDKATTLDDDKLLGKLDWNINPSNRLSARYSYSAADNTDNFQSTDRSVNFGNNAEFFPSRTHSTAVELNSTFGSDYANKLLVGYTRVSDDRGIVGDPFPAVSINDGIGSISLGSEPFSTANVLDQDVFTVTNNFNVFRGPHTLTFGANFEYYSIANLFIPQNFGDYEYDGLGDFLQSVCAAGSGESAYCQANYDGAGPAAADVFQRGYSLVDGVAGDGTNAIGAFDAFQVGVYAQDEFRATDRLNLSFGLRLDVPKVTSTPGFAPDARTVTVPAVEQFYDLGGALPGETPGANLYLSPRFGFNYDAGTRAQPLQLRGGTGIFVGRVPFVWPGGMFLNNGTNSGFVFRGGGLDADGDPIPFIADPSQQLSGSDFGQSDVPSGRLEIFEDNFRFPTVWRSALGVDLGLPAGFVGTLEGQFTKNLDNIEVVNVNLNPNSLVTVDGELGERRVYVGDDVVIDDRYSAIHRVGSTSQGYTYDVTARVQNELRDFLLEGDRLLVNVAYTYGDAYGANEGTSSQINSLWRGTPTVQGLNDLETARSQFSIGNRVLASAVFRKAFFGNAATTVSLFYTGESGRPFSYTIDNSDDLIGAPGGRDAGLLFVSSDFDFNPVTFTRGDETVTLSAAESRAAFDAFVASSDYLSGRAGDYAERNGSRTPFENIFDLRLEQEVFANFAGRNRGLSVALDVFNVGNLLNSDWGARYANPFAVELVEFRGFRDEAAGDYTPVYRLEFDPSRTPTEEAYFDTLVLDNGSPYSSRWFMQLGLRLNI